MRNTRKGDIGQGAVRREILGVIAALIVLTIFIVVFFQLQTGCAGDETCERVKAELERLTDNLDEACEESTLQTMDDHAELPGGTYNFRGASAVGMDGALMKPVDAIDNPFSSFTDGVTLTAVKFRDPPSPEEAADVLQNPVDAVGSTLRVVGKSIVRMDYSEIPLDWRVRAEANECERIYFCIGWDSAQNCHEGESKNVNEDAGAHWPFYMEHVLSGPLQTSGYSEGVVRYRTPEERIVNIRWVGFENGVFEEFRSGLDEMLPDVDIPFFGSAGGNGDTSGGDSGETSGNETGDAVSCEDEIDQARQEAAGQSCTQQVQNMTCPDGTAAYEARNGCEISYLEEQGWEAR